MHSLQTIHTREADLAAERALAKPEVIALHAIGEAQFATLVAEKIARAKSVIRAQKSRHVPEA
jgi:hypothetical protein